MGKNTFDAKRGTIFFFDPDELVIETDKDEALYDSRACVEVNENLVLNIMYERQGVLQPITITKIAGDPVVVDGRQRVKANIEANRRLREMGDEPLMIPTFVRRGNDKLLVSAMHSANEHRLEDGPMTKAEKLAQFLNHGGTEAEAAAVYGVSGTTIDNWKKLLELAPKVKKMVEEKKISSAAAAKLAHLDRKEQVEKAKELIDSGMKTARAAEEVAQGKKPTPKPTKRMLTGKTIREAMEVEDLSPEVLRALRWVLNEEKHLVDLPPVPEAEEVQAGTAADWVAGSDSIAAKAE